MGTDQKPTIDIIRLYDIMDSTIPSNSASGWHLPAPRSHWLSHALVYRWDSAEMATVLSHQSITTTPEEVPGLLEDIIREGFLRQTVDTQRDKLYYGVTYKGLAAWYVAQDEKLRAQQGTLLSSISTAVTK